MRKDVKWFSLDIFLDIYGFHMYNPWCKKQENFPNKKGLQAETYYADIGLSYLITNWKKKKNAVLDLQWKKYICTYSRTTVGLQWIVKEKQCQAFIHFSNVVLSSPLSAVIMWVWPFLSLLIGSVCTIVGPKIKENYTRMALPVIPATQWAVSVNSFVISQNLKKN